MEKIKQRLEFIYGSEKAGEIFTKLTELMKKYKTNKIINSKNEKYGGKVELSEKDSIVITYGDSVLKEGKNPLASLHEFLVKNVGNSVGGVHILPFFPYSSDDGFSVIDYKKVNPSLGDWEDVRRIGKDYRLMADLVINHMSQKSDWFQGFLKGDEKYKDYFVSFNKEVDVSSVFRPRMNPLLTKFETSWGDRYVWTTFSEDQIDLNFANPDLFLEMIDILLFYLSNSIEMIRLDAIGFLWKELGTNCFHLDKTHEIVKLFRDIFEEVAPYAVIITETNVPYKDNVSYFGDNDEAYMVYQFSYPPLVLDAFLRGDSRYLQKLFKRLKDLKKENLFFNFLASHDGVGVLAARDFLSDEEFENMLEAVKGHQGHVSYKPSPNGEVPYEMNINYFDAINDPNLDVSSEVEVKKFLASQALIVFSKGVPGIYIHSLFGSRNDEKGVEMAMGERGGGNMNNIYRRINRERLDFERVGVELDSGRRKLVLDGFKKMLKVRSENSDFGPYISEEVIDSDKRLLVFKKETGLVVIINVSSEEVELSEFKGRNDLLGGEVFGGKVGGYGVKVLK